VLEQQELEGYLRNFEAIRPVPAPECAHELTCMPNARMPSFTSRLDSLLLASQSNKLKMRRSSTSLADTNFENSAKLIFRHG